MLWDKIKSFFMKPRKYFNWHLDKPLPSWYKDYGKSVVLTTEDVEFLHKLRKVISIYEPER